MVTKAIFIIALSLTSLLGTSPVQNDMEQISTSCTTLESVINSMGGGFTDLIITRQGIVVISKEDCGILSVTLSTDNRIIFSDEFAEPQQEYLIPLSVTISTTTIMGGDFTLAVKGDKNCYDYHSFSLN